VLDSESYLAHHHHHQKRRLLIVSCRFRWQLDGPVSLDLTRDLHRLVALDISDDAYDGRVNLLSAMFGKKDLQTEMSFQKDRAGAAGAGFNPPTSGNLRMVVLRTLFPLSQHSMSADGIATLHAWLQKMRNEACRLAFLLCVVPMYHWAGAPSAVAQLMTFLKEKEHAALLLAAVAAQIGPFCSRSELINSISRSGVSLSVIQSAAVCLGSMARTDSSNLNGQYSLTLTHIMDAFLLRTIIHRDCFVSHTLAQRNHMAVRPRSRGADQHQQSSAAVHVYPPRFLDTLVLAPVNEDFEVPQLSSFAYGVLQHQIHSLISHDNNLQRALKGLCNFFPKSTDATNGALLVTAAGLEKLVESEFRLLNNPAVVAFSIKCTSSVKVRIFISIQYPEFIWNLQIAREKCYGPSHSSEFLQKLLICYRFEQSIFFVH
jgi:hypothetical protein